MLGNSLHILKNVSKYSFPHVKSLLRSYSRRVNSNDVSYKRVPPRKVVKDANNLVWRDPNFELLASTGFPLFLRGHIGVAWYDSQTTVKTNNELIMEQIDDINDPSYKSMVCRVQSCPTVLRKTVCDLFPYHPIEENSELSVITITLKSNIKYMRINKELETEKMAQTFLLAAKNICDKLKSSGYWADFINPFSGRPYFSPTSLSELYKTDEKFRCMDFEIFEIKNCKIICNENDSQNRFVVFSPAHLARRNI
ncbi:methylmalonic aciduria and homocystinuria type D homolog, mitochondrial-like isoform X2 [Anoplophora glabripennis]|uniref:methylmalonic aciduria and homocystinuria type D homolog, mitochondrial-like isoform X2 n=1 Tax=Anoplophora glabripennis TaxID=217634 RepID=UPI000874402F|nr:methylmalonic aciduria and homocystinuria type D homolog, mitochondrial-like isoform X2 [Anoplophora glabripennis]